MKRTNRALLTSAALLSCTLAFSGCSLIDQVVPKQDGESGEQAEADGQQQEQGDEQEQDSGDDTPASDSGSSSSDEGSSSSDSGTTGTDGGGTSSDSDSTGSDDGQSSGNQTDVNIGESFDDPEMEDKIEVIKAVRNFDSKERDTAIDLGGEVVLLQVKVTPGKKYSGLIQSGAFKISNDGGSEYRHPRTTGMEDEMKAAGYDPFEDLSRRDGEAHEGWIAYVPDEKKDTYKIRYERGAGKVMGTEEKIPEFEKTIDIPNA
jgi:hypothetical protein